MPPNNPEPEQPNIQPTPSPNPSPVTKQQSPQPHIITPGQYSAQPYVGAPEPEPLPKKRRLFKVLLILLVVLVLGGSGGAYAYWTVLNNRPEKVLADALSNTMTDILARRPTTTLGSLVYEAKGEEAYKITLDFDSKQANDKFQGGATLRLEGYGKTISLKGNLIVIDTHEAYVKFDDLVKTVQDVVSAYPEIQPWSDASMPFVRKIDGRWIKIDTKSISETGLTGSEKELDACSEAVKKLRIQPEDQKQIKQIFSENQFAIASEKLPKQAVDGEDSFHYKLDLNRRAGLAFIKEVEELPSFATVKKNCHLEQQTKDFDRELSDLDESHNKPHKPVIELWVGTKTRLPTKFRVTMKDKELTSTFNTTVKIDAKGVNITPPAGAMPLEDLLQDIQQLSSDVSI